MFKRGMSYELIANSCELRGHICYILWQEWELGYEKIDMVKLS